MFKEILSDDYDEARELYGECFKKKIKKRDDRKFSSFRGLLLGMYKDEELIGLGQIDYWDNLLEAKKCAYLNSICIKEKYRNLGYGDRLLKECIRICRERGVDYIQLTSNKGRIYAQRLYKKNDFKEVETVVFRKDLV